MARLLLCCSWLAGAAWTMAPPAGAGAPLGHYLDRRVASIKVAGPSTLDPNHAVALLPMRVGDVLTRARLKSCVQALYDTGYYRDIQVQAQEVGERGVALVFLTTENYFAGAIWIEDPPKAPPTHAQLVNATKLELGELITEAKIQQAIQGVQQALAVNGYRQAAVTVRRQPIPERQQMELTFIIKAGRAATLGAMQVTGDSGTSPEELQETAKLRPGQRVGVQPVRAALDRLRKKYVKHDELEAQVAVTHTSYQQPTNTEDLTLDVNRGPKVGVEVRGAHMRKGLIKKYVPVYEENAVDPDLLNEGARNLRDYFQTQGYYDAQVTYTQATSPDQKQSTIVYTVDKGSQHQLKAIAFEGNQYFDGDTLREHMSIQPSNLELRHGRFSQTLLARDISNLENLYRTNGFQQVSIRSQIQEDYKGAKGHIKLELLVSEGPQTRVQSLTITGNQAATTDELLAIPITGTQGQPFSEVTIANDRDAILTYYLNNGFPDVQFEATVKQVASDPPTMAVIYNIQEGQRVFVNHVYVSGLHFTRPEVVQRELELKPGDPLSQSAMVQSQQNFYNLGLFNQVDTAIQNPEGTAAEKNVLFDFEEASRWTFDYGLGLEVQTGSAPGGTAPQGRTGVSPRVSFDVSRINFFGRDQTVSFRSRYGRLEQEALVSFEAPRWFNDPKLRFVLTTFYDVTRDVRTFTAERLEGSAQVEQRLGPAPWPGQPTECPYGCLIYGFLYRRVKVDPRTLAIDPNLIPLLSKPVRVGMPTLTYIRDKRDSPLESHKGSYNTFDTGVSSSYFGSEASFSRFLFTNSTYYQFRKSKWVFARSTQIGVENKFANSAFVPLPERFYAGGANSLRAFSLNQAGPRDMETGFPVGGEALLLNQMELRFPSLTLPFVGNNLAPVLFEDAGNVFSSVDEMFPSVVRFNPTKCELKTNASTCDFNYFAHAVGLGVRYRTPIGPVRLDLSYALNPPTFPVLDDPTRPLQSLRHWNLFFSIGQSF